MILENLPVILYKYTGMYLRWGLYDVESNGTVN